MDDANIELAEEGRFPGFNDRRTRNNVGESVEEDRPQKKKKKKDQKEVRDEKGKKRKKEKDYKQDREEKGKKDRAQRSSDADTRRRHGDSAGAKARAKAKAMANIDQYVAPGTMKTHFDNQQSKKDAKAATKKKKEVPLWRTLVTRFLYFLGFCAYMATIGYLAWQLIEAKSTMETESSNPACKELECPGDSVCVVDEGQTRARCSEGRYHNVRILTIVLGIAVGLPGIICLPMTLQWLYRSGCPNLHVWISESQRQKKLRQIDKDREMVAQAPPLPALPDVEVEEKRPEVGQDFPLAGGIYDSKKLEDGQLLDQSQSGVGEPSVADDMDDFFAVRRKPGAAASSNAAPEPQMAPDDDETGLDDLFAKPPSKLKQPPKTPSIDGDSQGGLSGLFAPRNDFRKPEKGGRALPSMPQGAGARAGGDPVYAEEPDDDDGVSALFAPSKKAPKPAYRQESDAGVSASEVEFEEEEEEEDPGPPVDFMGYALDIAVARKQTSAEKDDASVFGMWPGDAESQTGAFGGPAQSEKDVFEDDAGLETASLSSLFHPPL